MSVYEKSKRLSDKDFKQLMGVKRETFAEMVAILTEDYLKRHINGGGMANQKPRQIGKYP
ncbi:MAG: hypothetical protein LBC82_05315 [Oscillospiraceae bacterium]|jgi:hypothetical protein|nr:hypothetical protein [Oscillospiraceae bacterium]